MVIKSNTVALAIVIFGILFINSGCHKSFCTPHHYNFSINNTIFYPELDSMAVGDTLFFKSETPTNLINIADGKAIDYGKASNFGSIIGFTELVGLNQTNGAVDDFIIISNKGKIYTDNSVPSPDRVKQAIFAEENGEYLLSFAVIPQKKGIYALGTGDMPDVVKNCDRSAISMKITNVDPHLHYIKDIYYGGGPINPLDSTHSYCFKVY
jgi:hypothetical protein